MKVYCFWNDGLVLENIWYSLIWYCIVNVLMTKVSNVYSSALCDYLCVPTSIIALFTHMVYLSND